VFDWFHRAWPATDHEFAIYIRLGEHVPVTLPLSRKYILVLLDLLGKCHSQCLLLLPPILPMAFLLLLRKPYLSFVAVANARQRTHLGFFPSMLALLASLGLFPKKVLLEIEAFYTWRKTTYLGLKANRQRIGQGHTSKVTSIQKAQCVFP
jgi:hypothetical protein